MVQCEQIQGYLADYAAGQLPGYKIAWTAQHLAGCEPCRDRLDTLRSQVSGQRQRLPMADEAPVAATVESVGRLRRTGADSVQRPVPFLLRSITLISVLGLVGGAAWFLLAYVRTGW